MAAAGSSGVWRLSIDTGGTFTDCLARAPDGTLRRVKVLSSSALRGRLAAVRSSRRLVVEERWELPPGFFTGCRLRLLAGSAEAVRVESWDPPSGELRLAAPLAGAAPGAGFEIRSPEEAPVLAARLATSTPPTQALPPIELRLATTRGTNALLERRGARVALLITRGFADLPTIGTQQRPDLFALAVRRPPPLAARVVEIDERLAASGEVLAALDPEALDRLAEELLADGCESFAVAFAHAFRDPAHERLAARRLRRAGAEWISESSLLAPRIGLLDRARTAVVDAYLAPVIGRYVERVEGALGEGSRLRVMTSAGGLIGAAAYRAKDSLLSGPAGGVVGAAAAGRRSGLTRLIAFDMGGTSTDVSRFDGDHEYRFEHEVGGIRLLAPALAIETVAAGGGSVCRLLDGRVRVGPESAGADPGPACYGAGGPLTLTDVNLLLGRLDPRAFGIPIEPAAARSALAELARRVAEEGSGAPPGAEGQDALLVGLLDIADERMAEAIRAISVRRGYDPRDHALVAFGGAGAQHACAVAALLGMRTVLVPEDAALLSARGLAAAVVERFAERQVLAPLAEVAGELERWLGELAAAARAELRAEGFAEAEIEVRRRLAALRFSGQQSTIEVVVGEAEGVAADFDRAYLELYGYRPERRTIEVESLRVVASSRRQAETAERGGAAEEGREARPAGRRRALLGGSWREVPVYRRDRLAIGDRFAGPALVAEAHSATVVEAGWRGRVDGARALRLERGRDAP